MFDDTLCNNFLSEIFGCEMSLSALSSEDFLKAPSDISSIPDYAGNDANVISVDFINTRDQVREKRLAA